MGVILKKVIQLSIKNMIQKVILNIYGGAHYSITIPKITDMIL